MISRRQLLKVGAASIAVTGAGLGLFAATRRPDSALAPWSPTAHDYQDPRIKALSYAILAPNPHNRQPWRAELIGDDTVIISCDLGRRLPHTDPFDRQITIGLGCFIELFALAASADGFRTDIVAFPKGEPSPRLDAGPVARLTLVRDALVQADPLFAFAPTRRSNKEAYDTSRPLDPGAFQTVLGGSTGAATVAGTLETSQVAALRDLSWRAYEIEVLTPRTLMESIDLMRIGKAEITANPDGIDMGGFMLELLAAGGMLSREQLADPSTTAFQQGMDMYRGLMFSAMGHVWIRTPDNSRAAQLDAGREWLRINLRATANGVAIHPISQALQEYEEMSALLTELHAALAVPEPARIQMFARVGYGPEIGPSPRWPVENCLVGRA